MKIQIDFTRKILSFEDNISPEEMLDIISKYIPEEEKKEWKISQIARKIDNYPFIPISPCTPNVPKIDPLYPPYRVGDNVPNRNDFQTICSTNTSRFNDVEVTFTYQPLNSLLRDEDFKKCRL